MVLSRSVVFLQEARERRDRASHVRHLCWGLGDHEAVKALKQYAAELEEQAVQLEAQAERAEALTADIRSEIKKAHETIAEIKGTLAKADPSTK